MDGNREKKRERERERERERDRERQRQRDRESQGNLCNDDDVNDKTMNYRVTPPPQKKKTEPINLFITSTKIKQNNSNFVHSNFWTCW